jgi:hypothetical protein
LTAPEPETVSAAEFEQMKRDLDIERGQAVRHTSTLSKRLARTAEEDGPMAPAGARPSAGKRPRTRPAPGQPARPAAQPSGQPARPASQPSGQPARPAAQPPEQARPAPPQPVPPAATAEPSPPALEDSEPITPAPDIAENEGMAPMDKPKSRPKSRNRRHGRRR